MGLIQRQAFIGAIFIYLGIVVGFITTSYLFPLFLTSALIGLLGIINSWAGFFEQIFSFGFPQIGARLFPKFRNEYNGHNGFLFMGLIMIGLGTIITAVLVYFFSEEIAASAAESANSFQNYVWLIVPLFFFKFCMIVYDTYIRMLYNAVIGQFFRELAQRVFMFLAFLLFLFWHQTEEFLVYMYAAAMCTPGLFIFFYPIIKKVHFIRPNFTFLNPEFRKELLPVILFGTVSSGTLLLLTEVDKLMIFRYLGEAPLGIYITLMNYGIFVSIANRALKSIAIPVIAEELKKENLGAVHRIYNSSSINLYLIGAWVFLCVWFNIELILEQFPTTEYLDHKYIVLFLGLGHLIEMLTGLNAEIIATSKYYRYNAYFNGLLVFLLVSFNYLALFVWDIGLEGVAAGTLFSMLIINIIRFIFLKVKFGFHPFTRKTILLTIAVIGIFIIALFLPFTGHMIFDIIWRSLVITALLAVYTLYFSISTEVSAMAAKYLPFYNSKKG